MSSFSILVPQGLPEALHVALRPDDGLEARKRQVPQAVGPDRGADMLIIFFDMSVWPTASSVFDIFITSFITVFVERLSCPMV